MLQKPSTEPIYYWKLCDEWIDHPTKDKPIEDDPMLKLTFQLSHHFSNYQLIPPQDAVQFYHKSWTPYSESILTDPHCIILVYDGSFAPVHYGHLSTVLTSLGYIQKYYQKNFSPNITLLITANHPIHLSKKLGKTLTHLDASISHRNELLRLAFSDEVLKPYNTKVILTEDYPSYSINTLQTITRAIYMMNNDLDRVWFLVGDDALRRLRYQLCLGVHVIISMRCGQSLPEEIHKEIPEQLLRPPHLYLMTPEVTDMSSTAIRKYCQGLTRDTPIEEIRNNLDQLVRISTVRDYIIDHKLYRKCPLMIGITGMSGAGKTTLAKKIEAKFEAISKKVYHINMDDYFREDLDILPHFPILQSHLPWCNWDTEDSINWNILFKDIWNVRIDEQFDVIIVEGGHFMASQKLREICHKVFYLDLPEEECRKQRLARGKKKTEEVMVIWLKYWNEHLVPFAMKNRAKALADKGICFITHSDPEWEHKTFEEISNLISKFKLQ